MPLTMSPEQQEQAELIELNQKLLNDCEVLLAKMPGERFYPTLQLGFLVVALCVLFYQLLFSEAINLSKILLHTCVFLISILTIQVSRNTNKNAKQSIELSAQQCRNRLAKLVKISEK